MSIAEVTDASLDQTIEIAMGDPLVVRLSENPSTGFRWQVSQSGAGELRPTGDRFELGGAPLLPGAAGHRVLSFVASRAGSVTLSLVQRRLPEPPSGQSKQVTVIVRAR